MPPMCPDGIIPPGSADPLAFQDPFRSDFGSEWKALLQRAVDASKSVLPGSRASDANSIPGLD